MIHIYKPAKSSLRSWVGGLDESLSVELKVYTAKPPEFFCRGSPAASNVPFANLFTHCAALCPGAIQVTL